jgi:hypothetical protein
MHLTHLLYLVLLSNSGATKEKLEGKSLRGLSAVDKNQRFYRELFLLKGFDDPKTTENKDSASSFHNDPLSLFHQLDHTVPPPCSSSTEFREHDESFELQRLKFIPRNLHIAFIGDSLTRYMYLSLANYFRWGVFECDNYTPSIVREKDHGTWHNFYLYTKEKLSPYEQCDCWKREGLREPWCENRYYWDPILNNSLTMIAKAGSFPTIGHLNGTDVLLEHGIDSGDFKEVLWNYGENWADIITHHLAKLPQKPDYIIFNAGIWPNHGLESEIMQDAILQALEETSIVGIYKTTTRGVGGQGHLHDAHDANLCRKADYCLDLSWTAQVPAALYWDSYHFLSSVYNQMNVQLLDLLYRIKYGI